ncbi:hypothetical protein [Pelagicoccus mobilis]|uniref:Uncharacterized protein n=1 Tax=Pelagicoccus mobilis TaxID=415221 RepID=A0A934VTN2_9BACT|nr:hypothetical protein [Pelagicoccus mobilis]MBK1880250.1 hypothetical protein [Pelagicoccus mobilis]
MIGIRPLHAGAIWLLSFACAHGTDIPIVFNILESSRTETIAYSTGNSSEQVISHQGTMHAVLSFDPTSQKPTAIRFTGGVIRESDATFKNTAKIHFTGFGTKNVGIEQSSSGLQIKVETLGGPHDIDDQGWVQETDRILTYPIAGILTAKLTIDGRTQTQRIDVALDPPDSVESSMGPEIRLEVVETEGDSTTSTYKLTFHTTLDLEQSEKIPDTNTTLTSKTAGTTTAEAEFSAPNKFGQWLLDGGYELEDEDSTNEHGTYLAALYAFSLPASEKSSFPWSFTHEAEGLTLTLHLPENGLQRGIQIESCDNLRNGAWHPLPPEKFLDGASSLEQGETGPRRIRFPNAPSQFYRLVPADPDN